MRKAPRPHDDRTHTHPTTLARERLAGAFAGNSAGVARPEVWYFVAYCLLGLCVSLYVFLGLRIGGRAPLYAWRYARDVLFLAAFGTLLWALLQSLRRRPFLQPRRLRPLLALAVVLGVTPFQFPYPSSHESQTSALDFQLPLAGNLRVLWGGEGKEQNRLASFFAEQRWALALAREEGGVRRRGEMDFPEDSLSFGTAVLAPLAGRVVRASDTLPDGDLLELTPGVPQLGNHLVLEVATGEYLFFGHLRQGSIQVQVGASVSPGQTLAEVGSSGSSRLVGEPHLLILLQDSAEIGQGEPIPWRFVNYFQGERLVERGLPEGGVSPAGQFQGALVRRALPP